MEKVYLEKAEDVDETSLSFVEEGVGTRRASLVDEVFGEITDEGPNYRNVSRPEQQLFISETHFISSDGWELQYSC